MKSIAMLLSNPFRPDPRVLKEAKSLQALGYKITVICWDRRKEYPATEQLSSGVILVRIQDIPSGYGMGLRQVPKLIRFWIACLRLLDELQPELLHCHDFDTLPAGLWWGKIHSRPVVYDAHEYYADLVKPRLQSAFGRLIYRLIRAAEGRASGRASAVITVDETLAQKYRQRNPEVLVVGHYPPLKMADRPAQVFQGIEHPARPVRLIYIGRLSADRGSMIYLEILRSLLAQGIPARLSLTGVFTPTSEAARFWETARGAEQHIDFTDWIAYNAIQEKLLQADVGLALLQPEPRYVAALPVKLFEYMAVGLPVIASDFPMIREVVGSSRCGIVINPQSVEEAVHAILGWIKEPQIAIQLGQNGRKAVIEKYHWETLVSQIDRLYQKLAGS